MASYLVTGAGRGLGLELVAQLHALPSSQVSTIFATTRSSPSAALQGLIDKSSGRIVHVPLVINDKSSINRAVDLVSQQLGSTGLDVVVNNAGIQPYTPDGIENMDNLREAFETNVEAVHNVTAAFLPLLRKSQLKKVVNITSTLGSIGLAPAFKPAPTPAYKISKTALNMLTVQWAQDLSDESFTIIGISPGWLQTDMGSKDADLPVEVGVKEVIRLMLQSGPESTGKFLNIHVPGWENAPGPNQYDGKEPPW